MAFPAAGVPPSLDTSEPSASSHRRIIQPQADEAGGPPENGGSLIVGVSIPMWASDWAFLLELPLLMVPQIARCYLDGVSWGSRHRPPFPLLKMAGMQ